MEYDEALQRAGSYGNYQKFLICLLAIPAIFNATTTQVLNFIVGNHLHRYISFVSAQFCNFKSCPGKYYQYRIKNNIIICLEWCDYKTTFLLVKYRYLNIELGMLVSMMSFFYKDRYDNLSLNGFLLEYIIGKIHPGKLNSYQRY